jgi:predicted component of type VI protein secretion system
LIFRARTDFVRCERAGRLLSHTAAKELRSALAHRRQNSPRFECGAQATILSLLRCGIARLTVNAKSPRGVSHALQPKVCEPASLVAPSQIRPRIGDALRRQELDAIPSTDKAAESWAAFFVAVFF